MTTASSAGICVLLLATGAQPRDSGTEQAVLELAGPMEQFPAAEKPVETGLALYGGKFHLNPEEFPVVGSHAGDAPTAVLLCDYTSELSRRYLAAVQTSLPMAANPVRIIVVPAAVMPKNEDTQRIILALNLKAPAAWQTLSALITSGQIPADARAVERVARKLAGAKQWAEALEANADKITRQAGLGASLLTEISRGGKPPGGPVLIQASRVLMPTSPDMNELAAFLRGDAAPVPHPNTPSVEANPAAATSVSPPAPVPKTAS